MRVVLGGVAGALALAVAACNSSGSPTPSPTPTPTPTPTGTPTPTPTPTPVTFTTSESGLQYTLEGGVQRVANTTAVPATMGTTFRFTPDLNGYSYVLLNGSVNPSASETAVFPVNSIKTCDRPTLCFAPNAFAFAQVPAGGGGNYYLSRLIPGAGNPLISLTFIAFGVFEEAFVDAGGGPRTHVDLRPFAYGNPSPASGLPTTGTQTFTGALVGQATGNKPAATGVSNVYRVTGNFTFVPNYANGTATLKLNLTGTAQNCNPCAANFTQTIDANGTIAAGIATFALTGGNARFFFGGPNAQEAGGSFVLTLADPAEAGVTMTLAGSGAGTR